MPDLYFVSINYETDTLLLYMEPSVNEMGVIFVISLKDMARNTLYKIPIKMFLKDLHFKIDKITKYSTILNCLKSIKNYKLLADKNGQVILIAQKCLGKCVEEYNVEEACSALLKLSSI
jgi:hypothetical protein